MLLLLDAINLIKWVIKMGILAIIKILPQIFQILQAVEEVMPPSSGKEKLEFAINTIEKIIGDIVAIKPAVESIIAFAVKMFNSAGVFKKSGGG